MNHLVTVALFLLVLPGVCVAQPSEEAALRAIVTEQAVAWNAGNAAGYAARVAPEASFTNIFGMVMYGGEAFAKRHAEILATFYKGTTKTHVIRRIRLITPDVASVDIDNEVRGIKAMPAGVPVPPGGVLKTQLMEVFVKRNGEWWVEAYQAPPPIYGPSADEP
jgi:uncharacterized protein (TIGR02246 family)